MGPAETRGNITFAGEQFSMAPYDRLSAVSHPVLPEIRLGSGQCLVCIEFRPLDQLDD